MDVMNVRFAHIGVESVTKLDTPLLVVLLTSKIAVKPKALDQKDGVGRVVVPVAMFLKVVIIVRVVILFICLLPNFSQLCLGHRGYFLFRINIF